MGTSRSNPITVMHRRPDFMILGAMKSGSTTLYEYLDKHPRIFMCSPKEPMFFSRQENFSKGLGWYFSLFSEATEDQICGEASTCYSRWPYFGDVAGRIHESLPDTRFIYVMRHPVDRAYSHYRHLMEHSHGKSSGDPMSFDEAIEKEPEIVDTSLYRLQIEKFLEYFPMERFHLLFFEEMKANPKPVIEKVQQFLGLDLDDKIIESEVVANPFGSELAKRNMEAAVSAIRHAPIVSSIVDIISPELRALIRSRLTGSSIATATMQHRIRSLKRKISPLEMPTRIRLLKRFADANRELEELLGRSVPKTWHE